jgi:hypothetical protein
VEIFQGLGVGAEEFFRREVDLSADNVIIFLTDRSFQFEFFALLASAALPIITRRGSNARKEA